MSAQSHSLTFHVCLLLLSHHVYFAVSANRKIWDSMSGEASVVKLNHLDGTYDMSYPIYYNRFQRNYEWGVVNMNISSATHKIAHPLVKSISKLCCSSVS